MHITKKEYDALVAGGHIPAFDAKTKKLKSPYKSKAEQQFAWELEDRKKAGLIQWFAYEPITLVIVDADGKRCRFTPDFLVMWQETNGVTNLVFYEVKGFMRESARIRFLAARERYPFFTFRMVRKTRGGWEEIL